MLIHNAAWPAVQTADACSDDMPDSYDDPANQRIFNILHQWGSSCLEQLEDKLPSPSRFSK